MNVLIDYPLSESARLIMDRHAVDYTVMTFPHQQMLLEVLAKMPEHERESYDVLIGDALQVNSTVIELLPNLKWVHHFAAGLAGQNSVDWKAIDAASIVITTSKIQALSVSELAVALILSLLKNLPQLHSRQAQQQYVNAPNPSMLYDKSALIVGTGNIGAEIGRKLSCGFGVEVSGINEDSEAIEHFHRIGDMSELNSFIADADIVILACPQTDETQNLMSRERIYMMKPSALLINIARGGLLDQQALIDALHDGTIGGAALDVFEREPIDTGDHIWDAPNLIITPHIAGFSPSYSEEVAKIFLKSLPGYLEKAYDKMPTYANSKKY